MDTVRIKDRIRNYLENADERILKIINAIIEADENEVLDTHSEILEERLKYHQDNPNKGKSWKEVQDSLKEKFVCKVVQLAVYCF